MLEVTSTKLLETQAFGFYRALSDDSGNLYLSRDSSIFKLSHLSDSNNRTILAPPDKSGLDDGNPVYLMDYAVTPSGGLYLLGGDAKDQFHVFSFDSDGGLTHDSKLECPEKVNIVDFAVFDDETILATGFYDRDAPETVRGKSYAAIFDQSGQMLRDMANELSLEAADLEPDKPIMRTSICSGGDGNLYLLKPSAVLVLSPGGGIVRQIKFMKPDPSTHVYHLNVADGLISIQLGDPPILGKPVNPRYLVLDAMTGKEYGYYVPPAKIGRLTRFNREEGFIFLAVEKGKFKLTSAKMN